MYPRRLTGKKTTNSIWNPSEQFEEATKVYYGIQFLIFLYFKHIYMSVCVCLIKLYWQFLSTRFCIYPSKLPYRFYDIRPELVDKPYMIIWFPKIFGPNLGHHEEVSILLKRYNICMYITTL